MKKKPIDVNGRTYNWPQAPVVVVCIDGSEPGYEGADHGGYIDRAMEAGAMPFFSDMASQGTFRTAYGVVPSFTNPNNISIVTGCPPSVHGICGNFFYDRGADAEVMMDDPELLRAETIFKAFADAGARVAVITAKDKLRRMLGHGLGLGKEESICFSAEKAGQATLAGHGIANFPRWVGMPPPSVYSAALSEFVFAAGLKIMKAMRPDILYLSTTDFIQHTHAPGSPTANTFYEMIDGYLGQFNALGAVLAVTADHGMKAKHDAHGLAKVIYLQSLLDRWTKAGSTRVILPITDPYVIHHGALGGFATVYLQDQVDAAMLLERLGRVAGIATALTRNESGGRFELPTDRIGDIAVVADPGHVIGSVPDRHDLSRLTAPLRSHGAISEQRVPFILNRPTPGLPPEKRLRNFDIFQAALNHAQ